MDSRGCGKLEEIEEEKQQLKLGPSSGETGSKNFKTDHQEQPMTTLRRIWSTSQVGNQVFFCRPQRRGDAKKKGQTKKKKRSDTHLGPREDVGHVGEFKVRRQRVSVVEDLHLRAAANDSVTNAVHSRPMGTHRRPKSAMTSHSPCGRDGGRRTCT